MSMSAHKLVVVRCDGLSHSSIFKGWHSETAVFHYFNEAKKDDRTVYAAVFQSPDDCDVTSVDDKAIQKWFLRAEHHSLSWTK